MSATVTPPLLLTAEEYSRLPDDGRYTELVRGRVVEMPRPSSLHGYLCSNVDRELGVHVVTNRLGRVMTCDPGIVTEREPDTVRGPDVCFYSFARLPPGPLPEEGYVGAVPDLVVEVLSPSDRWPRVLAKVSEYLEAGVTAVCLVSSRTRQAVVYRSEREPESFAVDATLTFPDILPGFAVPVARLFE